MRTRKTISILLVFALLLTVGTVNPADIRRSGISYVKAVEETKFGAEDGDQAGSNSNQPYQISNEAQLRRLYRLIRDGEKNKNNILYSECYYVMINDITVIEGNVVISEDKTQASFVDADGKNISTEKCKEQQWNPIINFNGQFDANGHTISGLYVEADEWNKGSALFDYLGEKAVVKDLKIKNSVITKKGYFASVAVDFVKGISAFGTVEGCTSDEETCYMGELSKDISVTATASPTTTPETKPTATPASTPTATPESTPTATPMSTPTTTPETTPTTSPIIQAPSSEPTPAAPASTDAIEKGEKVSVGGVSYESVGNNEVSYNGSEQVKKGAVTIPNTVKVNGVSYRVTTVGKNAFAGNKKIKKVSLGKNVKTIGKGAFKNCTFLTSVKFPSNVKTVSDQAFYNCKKLKQVKLPATVKTIGKATFKNCVSMKKFAIGAKTSSKKLYAANSTDSKSKKISIGASAMENCVKLRQIVINAQVRRIGNAAFRQCKNLADILVYSLKLQYVGKRALKGVSNCKISVPKKKMHPYTRLFRNKGQGKKVIMAKLA